jgi:hypothetical protein
MANAAYRPLAQASSLSLPKLRYRYGRLDVTPLSKTINNYSLSKFHRLITDFRRPRPIDIRRFGERRLLQQPPRLT